MNFTFFGKPIKLVNQLKKRNNFRCEYNNIIIESDYDGNLGFECEIFIKDTEFYVYYADKTLKDSIQGGLDDFEEEIRNIIYDMKKNIEILSTIPDLDKNVDFYCTTCGCRLAHKLLE
jgi:hypothetical protein